MQSPCRIVDINSQQTAKQRGAILAIILGVAAAAAVTQRYVQIAVPSEIDHTGIVIAERLLDF